MKTLLLFFFISASSLALEFDGISESEFNNITKEFGANAVHSVPTSPTPMSRVIGIEFGVSGALTTAPEIEKLAKEQDPSFSQSEIPNANLFAHIALPFSVGFEATVLPTMKFSDFKIGGNSQAIKWTFSDHLFSKLPLIDMALKFHRSSLDLQFSQIINNASTGNTNVNADIKIASTTWGVNFATGLDLKLVKPYAGIGYVSTDNTMNVDSPLGTIFDPAFSTNQEESKTHSGTHYFVGAEVNLIFAHLGLEYANITGISRVAGKLSLAF